EFRATIEALPRLPMAPVASRRMLSEMSPGEDDVNSWLIWQLLDSAFPAGGFGHSGGLEAAWQHGEVNRTRELQTFLRSSLGQAARSAVPFVNAAYHNPERFDELDRDCDVWLSNHVANRASRLQG